MKSLYEDNCRIYKCPVCGHTYHQYYDDRQYNNSEEPFVELVELLVYEDELSYAPNRLRRLVHYACPKCGILQIDAQEL